MDDLSKPLSCSEAGVVLAHPMFWWQFSAYSGGCGSPSHGSLTQYNYY